MFKYILATLVVLAVLINANNEEEEKFVIHDGELTATPEIDDMVEKVEEQVKATLNYPELKMFKAVSYRTNFIIIRKRTKGTSYFVKVNTGDSETCIVLRIFGDDDKKTIVLLGIKENQPKNDPIMYFDVNLNSFNRK